MDQKQLYFCFVLYELFHVVFSDLGGRIVLALFTVVSLMHF